MSSAAKPFRIAVDDDVLDDLKTRLRRTRWPEAEPVDDWSQGVPLKWIEEVCRYWASDYDWRRREALLNRFPQFTTEIDGLNIHFLHVRSPHPKRPAADPHPRLARFDCRIPQGHRTAGRPGRARWRSRRRLQRDLSVAARLRLLGQAQDHRLGHRSHRGRLGQADGSPGLRPLRRAGRRLGLRGDHRARRAGRPPLRRHSHHARHVGAASGGRANRPQKRRGRSRESNITPTGTRVTPSSNRPGRRPWAMA